MARRNRRGRAVYKKILLPYKDDNSIFKDLDPNQHPKPVILRVNGAKIAIITPWDALCYLYTINFPKTIPQKMTRKNRKKYLRQVKRLFQHQNQICRWITIMEQDRNWQPRTINIFWK